MAVKRKRIISLLNEGFSQNDVVRMLGCSKRDVSAVAKMLKAQNISQEALANLTEGDIRQLVKPEVTRDDDYVQPDWEYLAKELSRPHVTRKLLWLSYGNTTVPEGKSLYQYSQFCARLAKYLMVNKASARVNHIPGRTCFVDWAGATLAVRDRILGKDSTVYIFVACLPFSGYFYVEGFFDMTQRSWITAHINAFEFFGGVTKVVTPDRCATALDRTPIYVTQINEVYNEFVEYMGAAVLPARSGKPKDKSGVEAAVGLVERWIVARLRDDVFFSLEELNSVIHEINDELNDAPFQVKEGSRKTVLEREESNELSALPVKRFEMYEWKRAKVSHDYHVQIDYMRYSVDHRLIGQTLDVRISDSQVGVYSKGECVAEHNRLYGRKAQYSTVTAHMPENHQYLDSSWSPDRFRRKAASIGPATLAVIEAVLASKPIIEQGFVPCANILGLARNNREELLEAACTKLSETGASLSSLSYTRVKNTLEAIVASLKAQPPIPVNDTLDPAPEVGRTRGADYYRRERS